MERIKKIRQEMEKISTKREAELRGYCELIHNSEHTRTNWSADERLKKSVIKQIKQEHCISKIDEKILRKMEFDMWYVRVRHIKVLTCSLAQYNKVISLLDKIIETVCKDYTADLESLKPKVERRPTRLKNPNICIWCDAPNFREAQFCSMCGSKL